ncbi:MAG TPA: YnbE family lipoprotein [Nitrospira sp.]|nr:YnbE family lipoprotein [Nitrospira sp.]
MKRVRQHFMLPLSGWTLVVALMSGCTPRVEVEPPDKPITINLNVKIDHEIKVKVDKELDQVLSSKSGLF